MARRGGTGLQYRVCVGDTDYQVRVRSVQPDGIDLEIDGRSYSVAITPELSILPISSPTLGSTHSSPALSAPISSADVPRGAPAAGSQMNGSVARAQDGAAASSPAVVAPMPGVVVAIPVAVGERVTQGAVVAVIEAMKMENSICAARSGVVSGVHVEIGREVERGQPILSLAE